MATVQTVRERAALGYVGLNIPPLTAMAREIASEGKWCYHRCHRESDLRPNPIYGIVSDPAFPNEMATIFLKML